jgi:hypothetical protein
MKRNMLVFCSALCSSGCGLLQVPSTPGFTDTSARDVLLHARSGNWVLRVNTDSTRSEGRVRLIDDESAMIADARVALRDIRSIERHVEIDLGGKPEGLMAGAGIGIVLGYLGRAFLDEAI